MAKHVFNISGDYPQQMELPPHLLFRANFVCLFETLPVFIQRVERRTLQATIFNFIWAHKRNRISKSVLQAPKMKGGLAVPDLLKYFWAAQLRRIPAWSSMFAYSKWMAMEKLWIATIHPNSLVWSTSQVKVDVPLLGPMLLTRDIWRLVDMACLQPRPL